MRSLGLLLLLLSPLAWGRPPAEMLAFSAMRGKESSVYLVRPDGTGLRRVIRDGRDPAFTPDGKALIFVRGRDLYRVNRNGTGLKRLTHHPADWSIGNPVASEDGSIIVFNRAIGAETVLRLYRLGSGEEGTIANPGLDASFTPDQVQIYFARDDAVFAMPRNAMDGPAYQGSESYRPTDTVEVRYPVYGGGSFAGFVYAARAGGVWQLRAVHFGPERPSETMLATNATAPAFNPTGTRIAFVRDGDLYVMHADGTHQTRLAHGVGTVSRPAWWGPES